MMSNKRSSIDVSEFLYYLASHKEAEGSLPALAELSRELGISVATLREQLEVARALGLVEVKPRTGMRRKPYTFASTVRQSLGYALMLDDGHFHKFSELRSHVEAAYWDEAVKKLTREDKKELKALISRAGKTSWPASAGATRGASRFAFIDLQPLEQSVRYRHPRSILGRV